MLFDLGNKEADTKCSLLKLLQQSFSFEAQQLTMSVPSINK